ncbi:unnamed protein product (mitochondrion) [Plasmodiophora brassicae]|uniref:B30.2/SPRY domain-containing protein n=1 Tax=Plasmodiophora brassicae TaxID=37360 RepID=A0A0G4IH24_PLABS|nr:hypothetical protein PBRA_000264 [Plasmodiophora brassicae]SPQ96825.1 unnamed protein product [Plasmodiophora brassicae]
MAAATEPEFVVVADLDCTVAVEAPNAPWRYGALATAVVRVGGASVPIQSQYFTNGVRASRLVFKVMVDRKSIRKDDEDRVIVDVNPPFHPDANPVDVNAKFRTGFVELHDFVMTGRFQPNIRTAVAVCAVAAHMGVSVHAEYLAYIRQQLSQVTAPDVLQSAWECCFDDLVKDSERVMAREFGTYKGRQFHGFVLRLVAEILECPELVSGGIYTVSDIVQSYLNHHQNVDVNGFERLTAPMTSVHEVNPQHCTFFVERIQAYEAKGELVASSDHTHRFAALLRRLEAMLAKNFFSFRTQELMVIRPGIFANMLLNPDLVVKDKLDVSNIVAAYLKEKDPQITTEEFYMVVKVMDDFPISADDVIFFANRIEHHTPLTAGLHAGIASVLSQVLITCKDVMARCIQSIPIASFVAISLRTLCDVLSRDALQCGHEDLVFDLVSDYLAKKSASLTTEEVETFWRTCRFHLLSSACLARAFQERTLPKEYLAAALIHKQRSEKGEVDERKCDFDSYAKSILVLRPRLSLEDLKAREEEDRAVQAVMDSQRVNPDRCSRVMQVADDGATICVSSDVDDENEKGAALFQHGFDCAQGGLFSFEVKIEKLPAEFWEVLVGVADRDHPTDKWVGATATSWCYLALHSGSRTYNNTVCGQYNTTETLSIGDTIGVLLDCTDRKSAVISFSVNSADKGNAFEDIHAYGELPKEGTGRGDEAAGAAPQPGAPPPANVFYPAVSLNRKGVQVKVGRFKWRRH